MWTRLRHLGLALSTLPGLLSDKRQRAALGEMRAFCHTLPDRLNAPLPDALSALTPEPVSLRNTEYALRNETTIRKLADLAALLDRGSPLGLCLRRSLTRYHFLRRAGRPVVLQFGAKFAAGRPDRDIHGHAWLTLNGQPYAEADENWRGFTVMFSYPPDSAKNSHPASLSHSPLGPAAPVATGPKGAGRSSSTREHR
jgi:hypothetical protein